MRHIKYTQVDSVTGIPVTVSPARNGPVPPAITGLAFGFALESQYPTLTPTYYGTAPDASDIDIPGVLGELTEAEYQAAHDAEIKARADKLVPKAVTMRQARLALLGAGLLAQVDTAIDALPEPDRTAARIEWEYSQEVQRDKPFVQMLAPALGLTAEDLDALFVQAATL